MVWPNKNKYPLMSIDLSTQPMKKPAISKPSEPMSSPISSGIQEAIQAALTQKDSRFGRVLKIDQSEIVDMQTKLPTPRFIVSYETKHCGCTEREHSARQSVIFFQPFGTTPY